MNAAFRTDGNTTTQSALSSKSCGMPSRTSRISFKTVPLFLNRSSSLVWSAALATSVNKSAEANRVQLKQVNNFRIGFSSFFFAVFLASDSGGGTLDATVKGEREFLKAVENKGFERISPEAMWKGRRVNSPAHWMIVNTLTTVFFRMKSVLRWRRTQCGTRGASASRSL